MIDNGIDKGLVRKFNTSDRNKRGWGKGFFGFRKMFWDYLTKLHVVFYDECCEDASTAGIFPVRWNENLLVLERFNGTDWVDISQIIEVTTTTTTTTSSTTTTTTTP